MSTTYTPNAKLGKPSVADRNWNLPLNANADRLDGLSPIGGLCVGTAETPSASLNVQAAPGRFANADGTIGAFAGSIATLPPSETCSIYLNASGALTVSTTGYPAAAHVPLATAVTGPTTVVSLADDRVVCASVGPGARPFLPLAGGALTDGATIALGTSQGARIGTAVNQKLGFWNAAPITRPGPYVQNYAANSRTLGAYTSAPSPTPYNGVASGLPATPYAAASDLNALRVAHENLRVFSENTTQLLNALINDLKAMGLLG